MTTPRELVSKVLRPIKPDAQSETPAPAVAEFGTTIERYERQPDGSVTVYRFTPGVGESTRTYTHEEAASVRPPSPSMDTAEALSVQQQLQEAGVR